MIFKYYYCEAQMRLPDRGGVYTCASHIIRVGFWVSPLKAYVKLVKLAREESGERIIVNFKRVK